MALTKFQKKFKQKYNLINIKPTTLEGYELLFYAENENITLGELVEKLNEEHIKAGYRYYETKKTTKTNFQQFLKRNYPEYTIEDFREVNSGKVYMSGEKLYFYFKK